MLATTTFNWLLSQEQYLSSAVSRAHVQAVCQPPRGPVDALQEILWDCQLWRLCQRYRRWVFAAAKARIEILTGLAAACDFFFTPSFVPIMHLYDFSCNVCYVCNHCDHLKGTQDWEFFWLWFWNLRYFFVSYVKILRFYKKKLS